MQTTVNFRIWNNIIGVLAFLSSAAIYLLTLEPTASLWDCSEFLACADKLEICHAPGNPLFLLLGRLAALLAGGNTGRIALMINATSAIYSALTIMFLYWTITWLGRKILSSTWRSSNKQKFLILASGAIGALAYAVSDSFWFSAVEAEVYALSSLFTAIVFWCITKWEEAYGKDYPERWLMLITYLFGLGIGVHLLNLLAIPAIVVLYYLKRVPFTWKNTAKAIIMSFGILGFILYLVIPGLPKFFSWFELLAVNTFGLSYNSGYAIGGAVILLSIGAGLYYAFYKKKPRLYNALVYVSLIMVGFSTYGMVIIRSNDNPSVDMNNPEDPFSLAYYISREQYEKRELFYGPSYASPIIDSKERYTYERSGGKYTSSPLIPQYVYDNNTLMPFPRMAGNRTEHANAYKQWVNVKGKPYLSVNDQGRQEKIILPTFGENIRFFLKYQLGFMYFRYFMWNFAGRQNDIQGRGDIIHGNWITGIPFIDTLLTGNQDKLPSLLKNNPGRNVYFLLPLLLGLWGVWYQYRSDVRHFFILMLLFFFTGIAIVIFINEAPAAPRERDYVYTGSFYVFCIWIGIGVMAIAAMLEKWPRIKGYGAIAMAVAVSSVIPVIMLIQNWDDHDRSGRYVVQEYARNYLESCEPNAILFTNADNDTYPLWYAQEVEGIRRDVQIVLFPYLSATWYVNQVRCSPDKPQGIALSFSGDRIAGGKRSFLPIIEKLDSSVDIHSLLEFVKSDDMSVKVKLTDGEAVNYIPSRKLFLKVNRNNVAGDKFTSGQAVTCEDSIHMILKNHYIMQDQLILFDILATNDWKRPVYFATVQEPMRLGLEKYLQLDGYAYKLTPFKSNPRDISDIGIIDSEALYEKYMQRFSFTSLANPNVYLDDTHITVLSALSLQDKFARLAQTLLNEGKVDKALRVLDKITTILTNEKVQYGYEWLGVARLYLEAGRQEKGEEMLKKLRMVAGDYLTYFQALPINSIPGAALRSNLFVIYEIMQMARQYHITSISDDVTGYWKRLENTLLPLIER